MTLLEARDVVAGYLPGIDILHGCNLTVSEGELIGMIGPNGAGKSTLLKAVFGLVDVRSGTVTLRDESITRLAAHELVAARRRLRPSGPQRVRDADRRGQPADGRVHQGPRVRATTRPHHDAAAPSG